MIDIIPSDIYTIIAIMAAIASLAAYSRNLVLGIRKRTEQKLEERKREREHEQKLLLDKVEEMIKHQNLANGNISAIGTTIKDLQKDVLSLMTNKPA